MHGAAFIGVCIVALVPLLGWLRRFLLLTHPLRGSGTASEAFAEQSTDDKIFITYGAAHLPGLVAQLRKLDSKWSVGSVKWMRTIEAPEHIEGKLLGLGK
jgi:hypothetical protein